MNRTRQLQWGAAIAALLLILLWQRKLTPEVTSTITYA